MKNILITGSHGFLGKNLKTILFNYPDLLLKYRFLTPSSKELDILDIGQLDEYFYSNHIDCIIHIAAVCGGIGLNKKRPADLTHLNNKLTVNIFDMIRKYNIEY